jgi:ABC-2 type transport system ATP-binding protein
MPALQPVAVQAEHVTKRFRHATAVDDLSFSVPTASAFGLLGRNGAGKSSTIKMLTTLSPLSAGRATVAGYDVTTQPFDVRRHIGYVPQLQSSDVDLTGYENLLVFSKLYRISRDTRRTRIAEVLELMGLQRFAHVLVRHYSGGMVRRLEIGQATLHHPEILFLDEPTVGLDPVARRAVWRRIKELRTLLGTTIFLTSHYMDEVSELCDEVAFLHDGRLVGQGTPAALCASVGPQATLDDVFVRLTTSRAR